MIPAFRTKTKRAEALRLPPALIAVLFFPLNYGQEYPVGGT